MFQIDFMSTSCEIARATCDEHSFRQWFGAVLQQAITWTNVDQFVCHHIASTNVPHGPIRHWNDLVVLCLWRNKYYMP